MSVAYYRLPREFRAQWLCYFRTVNERPTLSGVREETLRQWRLVQAEATNRRMASAPQPCTCERDPVCVRVNNWREFGEPLLPSQDWEVVQKGLALYERGRGAWLNNSGSREAKAVRWFFGLLAYVNDVEESCKAKVCYPRALDRAWYGNDVETAADHAKVVEDTRRWEQEHFLVGRSHALAFQPGDDERGFRADSRHVANEATLEREYGAPRVEKRAVYRGLDEWYEPVWEDAEVKVLSAVDREYQRRKEQERLGRLDEQQGRTPRLVGPWVHPRVYRYLMDCKRRAALNAHLRKLRTEVIRHLELVDLDPRDPKVAARVRELGYAETLRVLKAKLAASVSDQPVIGA